MDNFNVIVQYSHFLLTQNGRSLEHIILALLNANPHIIVPLPFQQFVVK